MAGQTLKAREALDRMYEFIMQHNGGFDPRQVFNIDPEYAQKIETKLMQDNGFLSQINSMAVDQIKGDVLAFGVPDTITARTNTTQTDGTMRRPTDPSGLVKRSYECNEIEQDSILTWKKIDRWGHLVDFYARFRASVRFAQQRDMLLMMWHGQGVAANTNSTTYPLLQDVMRGFPQYMIDNYPENVLGIVVDAAEPGGYSIDPVHIGPGAGANGFENIDIAVNYLRSMHIDRLFRKRSSMRVLIGEQLLIKDKQQIMGVPNTMPTERVAASILARTEAVGETIRADSDELPDHLIMVSELDNFSHYWLEDSIRTQYDEQSHGKKGVVNHYYKECDNVMEIAEACALIHPDAVRVPGGYDANGQATSWVAATDVWKKVVA